LHEKAREAYLHYRITPVLSTMNEIEIVLKDPAFKKLPLVIKLNTGMNRRGFLMNDLEQLVPKLKQRGIRHLMTHFARSASVIAPGDKCHKQMDEFIQMKKFLQDSGVSIEETSTSNSGAIEQGFGVSETYVRPGLMLYGPPSVTDPILWNGKQTSRFVTKILSTFQAKKGTPVGYGVNVADKDSFFVMLAVGYGDGFLTYYSGSHLKINGVTGKVFGRVNMDMIFVQFDPSAEKQIKVQDLVEIWNHDNKMITEFAIENKTHAYQVMCGISNRIPRIYKVK
jgi:alanine racemase